MEIKKIYKEGVEYTLPNIYEGKRIVECDATEVWFNKNISKMNADNVQDAIDETYKSVDKKISKMNTLTKEVVEELPTVEEASETVLYLKKESEESDIYGMYTLVEENWAKTLKMIGTTDTDLSAYYTKEEIDEKNFINKETAFKRFYGSEWLNINTEATAQSIMWKNFNNLPINKFYGLSLNNFKSLGITNYPPTDLTTLRWWVIFLSKGSATWAWGVQLFFEYSTGKIFQRIIWDRVWSEWFALTWNEWFILTAEDQASINTASWGKFSNVLWDVAMLWNTARPYTDTPFYGKGSTAGRNAQSGILYNERYSTNYNLQKFINFWPHRIMNEWYRITDRRDWSVYTGWQKMNWDTVKSVLAFWDSICYGARNSNKWFVGDLWLWFKNIWVSGATISTVRTDIKPIPQQLVDETWYSPDIIIAEWWINDYVRNAPMWTISTTPVTTDEEANLLDRSTVMWWAEFMFYTMIKKYPTAQRFFLITHKTKYQGKYCPTTPNEQWWTQQDLHDKLVEVCEMYNVKVIDVYKDSFLNSIFTQHISPIPYSQDSSVTDKYFIDNDWVHPLDLWYREWYIPLIRQTIQIGTGNI